MSDAKDRVLLQVSKMSEDTTWLKKNSSINPLRRSMKTSLRINCPNPDMDSSIVSNPDKKNPELFIPKMLQRSKFQSRMGKVPVFKVPELVPPSKGAKKKENLPGSDGKSRETLCLTKKSFLPVPKGKSQVQDEPTISNLPRQSFFIPSSGRRTMARKEILQKIVESSQAKLKNDVNSQVNLPSGDNSVLRSILKKRKASLRRNSQFSAKKPTAKKVLFNTSDNEEKCNDENESPMAAELKNSSNEFDALDEPTVFFTFPNSQNSQSSPNMSIKGMENFSWTVTDQQNKIDNNDFTLIMNSWNDYKNKVDEYVSLGNSLKNSLNGFFQHMSTFFKVYETFKKESDEMNSELSALNKNLDENLKKLGGVVVEKSPKPATRLPGRKLVEKENKIGISDKSKAIKRNGGKKLSSYKKIS